MLSHEYKTLRSVEERHWWYQVLRRLALRSLREHVLDHARVLDAGCGTGGMLADLNEHYPQAQMHGIDIAQAAVLQCRDRGLLNVQTGDVADMPFADETFDAVVCLDVLYHEQVQESAAFQELRRVLKPGGLLVLNLPALDCLRGRHDVAVCGARRYTLCHVRDQLHFHSMQVMKLHYWNAWSFPLVLAWRQFTRNRSSAGDAAVAVSDLRVPPAWLNHLLLQCAWLDAKLCHQLSLPFGSSVFAVARKVSCHALPEHHVTGN